MKFINAYLIKTVFYRPEYLCKKGKFCFYLLKVSYTQFIKKYKVY